MKRYESNIIQDIAKEYGPTSVEAKEFFISYNSVPTLAYQGFSQTLLGIKAGIGQRIRGIKAENPGSKWPKTSLGALENGKSISREGAKTLRTICDEQNDKLIKLPRDDRLMSIEQLQIVIFQCRSLEKRLATIPVPLCGLPASKDTPPDWHLEQVQNVMDQFSRDSLDQYYLCLDPNFKSSEPKTIAYYHKPHFEATLVFDLSEKHSLHKAIDSFIDQVNRHMSNYYGWFELQSRHMTVRTLVSEA